MKNTGALQGKAVAQVYVSGAGWEAPKRLGAFRKVDLAPGTEQTLSVTIDPRLLATFDVASGGWRIAGGEYSVMLATSAADVVQTVKVQVAPQTLDRTGK
ncbi:fibronectin type III-like domain-contianing protein [Sphingomonas aurantiaca]|uniref:fibronectin type III-like domain-contianing protein n=1 Tax=Sphingomonas aurantiaca TaxID=185949 RepID=UPI002FDF5855